MKDARSSILQMVNGAVQERVDLEVSRVVDNILDVNTEATAKRKITLTIELKPDKERQFITMNAHAKSSLAPVSPVGTTLAITADHNGEMMIAEMTPQVPGQVSLDGDVQEAPKLLKLAAQA